MTDPSWNPADYLQFADERSRPFLDLVARIPGEPDRIVDLGCGPGHLTAVLRRRWPAASILGVDSSPEMIDRARSDNRDQRADYQLADIAEWGADRPVDLIVSNATYQWLPGQLEVLTRLRGLVAPGGTFAFQVPDNFDAASHVLLHEISGRAPYAEHLTGIDRARGVRIEEYLELFAGAGWQVDAWQTSYLHLLPGPDPVFRWISATGARPVLQGLPDGLRGQFEIEYRAALREAYPARRYGTVLPFLRSFVVAWQV